MIKSNIHNIVDNVIFYRFFISCLYILITFIFVKAINFIILKLEKKIKKTDYMSNAALLLTIKTPLDVFIWITCFYRILILNDINLSFVFDLKTILVFGITAWLLFRFISQYTTLYIEKKENKKENIDYDGVNFIKKLVQIFIFVLCVIFCLSRLGISAQSLVAISGAGSLAIGLAAKEMLSNIFGGLMIYLDKPFAVGDWISSPDRNIEGDVEEIGWRRTRILTFAQHPIYVANSVFTDIIIENKARMKSRRIDEIIPIRYVDISRMDKITKDIKEMLKNHININHRLINIVCFDSVSSSATINLKVYAFANTIEWLRYTEIKQDILVKIIEIVQNNGGELAYNIQEVILKKEKQPTLIKIENSDVF